MAVEGGVVKIKSMGCCQTSQRMAMQDSWLRKQTGNSSGKHGTECNQPKWEHNCNQCSHTFFLEITDITNNQCQKSLIRDVCCIEPCPAAVPLGWGLWSISRFFRQGTTRRSISRAQASPLAHQSAPLGCCRESVGPSPPPSNRGISSAPRGRVRLDPLEVGKSWESPKWRSEDRGLGGILQVIHILHWLLTSANIPNFGVANQHSTVFDDTENPNNPQVHDPFWSLGSIRLWGSTSNFKAVTACVWWILIMYKYILYVCVHECVCVHINIYIYM